MTQYIYFCMPKTPHYVICKSLNFKINSKILVSNNLIKLAKQLKINNYILLGRLFLIKLLNSKYGIYISITKS